MPTRTHHPIFQSIAILICLSLGLTPTVPVFAQTVPQTVVGLPVPGTMLAPTQAFAPVMVKGMTVYPEQPLAFDFFVDDGDREISPEALKEESNTLITYFLTALTVPEKELWVNLSPYEQNRIVSDALDQTEMGRDLLAQDYMLKQLTASLMYPEEGLGQEFWRRVYARAQAEYGSTDIPLNTFNKIWIVPESADIYVNSDENQGEMHVFVTKSRLKVMLEEDYLALEKHREHLATSNQQPVTGITSEVVREVLIPEIEREVNEGETFAQLRQMYNAMILATWYKQNLKQTLLGQNYVDQEIMGGVAHNDPQVNQKIYEQYVESFKKGVYDYIKEEVNPDTQEITPRKYFSGGADLAQLTERIEVSSSRFDRALTVKEVDKRVHVRLEVDRAQGTDDEKENPADVRAALELPVRRLLTRIHDESKSGVTVYTGIGISDNDRTYLMSVVQLLQDQNKDNQYIRRVFERPFRFVLVKEGEASGLMKQKKSQSSNDDLYIPISRSMLPRTAFVALTYHIMKTLLDENQIHRYNQRAILGIHFQKLLKKTDNSALQKVIEEEWERVQSDMDQAQGNDTAMFATPGEYKNLHQIFPDYYLIEKAIRFGKKKSADRRMPYFPLVDKIGKFALLLNDPKENVYVDQLVRRRIAFLVKEFARDVYSTVEKARNNPRFLDTADSSVDNKDDVTDEEDLNRIFEQYGFYFYRSSKESHQILKAVYLNWGASPESSRPTYRELIKLFYAIGKSADASTDEGMLASQELVNKLHLNFDHYAVIENAIFYGFKKDPSREAPYFPLVWALQQVSRPVALRRIARLVELFSLEVFETVTEAQKKGFGQSLDDALNQQLHAFKDSTDERHQIFKAVMVNWQVGIEELRVQSELLSFGHSEQPDPDSTEISQIDNKQLFRLFYDIGKFLSRTKSSSVLDAAMTGSTESRQEFFNQLQGLLSAFGNLDEDVEGDVWAAIEKIFDSTIVAINSSAVDAREVASKEDMLVARVAFEDQVLSEQTEDEVLVIDDEYEDIRLFRMFGAEEDVTNVRNGSGIEIRNGTVRYLGDQPHILLDLELASGRHVMVELETLNRREQMRLFFAATISELGVKGVQASNQVLDDIANIVEAYRMTSDDDKNQNILERDLEKALGSFLKNFSKKKKEFMSTLVSFASQEFAERFVDLDQHRMAEVRLKQEAERERIKAEEAAERQRETRKEMAVAKRIKKSQAPQKALKEEPPDLSKETPESILREITSGRYKRASLDAYMEGLMDALDGDEIEVVEVDEDTLERKRLEYRNAFKRKQVLDERELRSFSYQTRDPSENYRFTFIQFSKGGEEETAGQEKIQVFVDPGKQEKVVFIRLANGDEYMLETVSLSKKIYYLYIYNFVLGSEKGRAISVKFSEYHQFEDLDAYFARVTELTEEYFEILKEPNNRKKKRNLAEFMKKFKNDLLGEHGEGYAKVTDYFKRILKDNSSLMGDLIAQERKSAANRSFEALLKAADQEIAGSVEDEAYEKVLVTASDEFRENFSKGQKDLTEPIIQWVMHYIEQSTLPDDVKEYATEVRRVLSQSKNGLRLHFPKLVKNRQGKWVGEEVMEGYRGLSLDLHQQIPVMNFVEKNVDGELTYSFMPNRALYDVEHVMLLTGVLHQLFGAVKNFTEPDFSRTKNQKRSYSLYRWNHLLEATDFTITVLEHMSADEEINARYPELIENLLVSLEQTKNLREILRRRGDRVMVTAAEETDAAMDALAEVASDRAQLRSRQNLFAQTNDIWLPRFARMLEQISQEQKDDKQAVLDVYIDGVWWTEVHPSISAAVFVTILRQRIESFPTNFGDGMSVVYRDGVVRIKTKYLSGDSPEIDSKQSDDAMINMFTNTKEVLMTEGPLDGLPDYIRHEQLPRNTRIVVFDDNGDADAYVGHMLRVLQRNEFNNKIVRVKSTDTAVKNLLSNFKPEYAFVQEGNTQAAQHLQNYANQTGTHVYGFEFHQLFPTNETLADGQVTSQPNLSVAGTEKELLETVIRAHASQMPRKDEYEARRPYDVVAQFTTQAMALIARVKGLLGEQDQGKYANNMVVGEINENGDVIAPDPTIKYQMLTDGEQVRSGYQGIEAPKGMDVVVVSPHSDDPEIALLFTMLKWLRGAVNVHNIIFSSGMNGVMDPPEVDSNGHVTTEGDPLVQRFIDENSGKIHKRLLRLGDQLLSFLNKAKLMIREQEAQNAAALIRTAEGVTGELSVENLHADLMNKDVEAELDLVVASLRPIFDRHIESFSHLPLLVSLAHPLDSHKTHRQSTERFQQALSILAKEYQQPVKLLYYLAPWSGDFNTFFQFDPNADEHFDLPQEHQEVGKILKLLGQGIAYTTSSMTGEHGKPSILPDQMGGSHTERVTRFVVEADAAMKGGIDLDAQLLEMNIDEDSVLPLPAFEAPLNRIQIQGITPIIIQIVPATNMPFLLGLVDTQNDEIIPTLTNHSVGTPTEQSERRGTQFQELDPLAKLNSY